MVANLRDIYGTVHVNSSTDLLARVVDVNGDLIMGANVASLTYSVQEHGGCVIEEGTVVDGHDKVALVVSEVFTDGLQTDGAWTVDAIGYNFRHTVDTSVNEAFLRAGYLYQVRYDLSLLDGSKVVFRYELKAI